MPMMTRARPQAIFRMFCALLVASAITTASASFHTFQVNELYTNADGTVQFIKLHEAFRANDEQFLSGHLITATQGATTHSFTFPNDLPSANTAGRHVLIATPAFAALGIVTPDYVMPAGFLFVAGASTVDYADVDALTYPPLPTDGVQSLNRDGTTGTNSPTNFAGQSGSISAPAPPPPPVGGNTIPTLNRWGIAALILALRGAAWFARRRNSMRQ
jgi:hypothetical protein